jgi:hypothetical protein
MAPRNINVNFANWRTGPNISIQRYLVDVSGNYLGDDGLTHTFNITVTFPDIIAQLSVADQKTIALEIMYRAYRVTAGIDGGINP